MNYDIFKAYDIRGVYPSELDEADAHLIGRGFALSRLLKGEKPVVVGRDMRTSSDSLADAISSGLAAEGHSIVDIGLCTTPMLYFAVNVLDAAGGIMVTASHNPGEYNGFKFVRERAIPIGSESGLAEIKKQTLSALRRSDDLPRGSIRRVNVLDRYAAFFADRFTVELTKPLVIDAGNGMAGGILPRILPSQKLIYHKLFFEPDGRFPNHEANPLKDENLRQLRETMKKIPGSVGIAFDGDGDRVCFLDESGQVVRGDLLTALLAAELLDENGGGKILYDLRSSRVVPEVIRNHGGEPIKTRVGHAFIKQIMREEQALFGGELSYHFYFSEFFNCESGILAMLQTCKLLAKLGKPLSELVEPLRKYAHSGEVNFRVHDVDNALRYVQEHFSDGQLSRLDGVSVDYDNWWFNLRASNTEPLVRLNLEADKRSLMVAGVERVAHLLKDV